MSEPEVTPETRLNVDPFTQVLDEIEKLLREHPGVQRLIKYGNLDGAPRRSAQASADLPHVSVAWAGGESWSTTSSGVLTEQALVIRGESSQADDRRKVADPLKWELIKALARVRTLKLGFVREIEITSAVDEPDSPERPKRWTTVIGIRVLMSFSNELLDT